MAKEKGYVFKDKFNRWFARTSYRDETGKYHNVKKVAKSRSHAKEVLKQLLRELDDHGGKSLEVSRVTVNRELGVLRRVLNVALANGWIHRSPFTMGKSLISVGDEKPRERILTLEEEARLLAACEGPRAHLRAILICALDTGMRRGEL